MFIKIKISGFDSRESVSSSLREMAVLIEKLSDEEVEMGGVAEDSSLCLEYEECNMEGE